LESHNYQWVDGLLLPCSVPDRRRETLSDNACCVICALPNSWRGHAVMPTFALSSQKEETSVAALAWSDWTVDVPIDPGRSGALSLLFDDMIPAFGLHRAETDGLENWWRWTGPTAHTRLVLPLPSAGRWLLTLEVFNWGVVQTVDQIRVAAQGQQILCVKEGVYFASFAPVTIPYWDAQGTLAVDIVTPAPRRTSSEDPRLIGISFCPPDKRFVVAGSICDRLAASRPQPFDVMGRVDHLDAFYDAVDAVVNPMTFGTGLKIKSVEAIFEGLPLIATEAAMIGLPIKHQYHQLATPEDAATCSAGLAETALAELAAASRECASEYAQEVRSAFKDLVASIPH
jgi:hypothetical protein